MGDPNEPPKTLLLSPESQDQTPNGATHIGDKYEVPAYEPHSSFDTLKQRIRQHYELASDYYYSLW